MHSKGGRGWFRFCEADMLVYGDAINQIFYVIPMEQLRARVEAAKPWRIANCGSDSTGILLNIKNIQDIVYTL